MDDRGVNLRVKDGWVCFELPSVGGGTQLIHLIRKESDRSALPYDEAGQGADQDVGF